MTSLVNALGQKIEVGTHVVLVSQGQGWADINVGTVEKFSRKDLPQIKYLNGVTSPPIQKVGRVYTIPKDVFEWHKKRHEVVERAKDDAEYAVPRTDWSAIVTEPYTPVKYGQPLTPSQQRYEAQDKRYQELLKQWKYDYKRFVNDALEAAGFERTYFK